MYTSAEIIYTILLISESYRIVINRGLVFWKKPANRIGIDM